MEKQNRFVKIAAVLLMMLFSSVMSVSASENVIEQRTPGSITIQLEDGASGTSKEGVEFSYAKVADVINGSYEMTGQFKDSQIDLNKIEYAKDLEKTASYLQKYVTEADGKASTDRHGEAVIRNLRTGVYLLWITDTNQYELITPLLVSIPTWDEAEKQMVYDVMALPKHGTVPTDMPKTGDEIPLLLYGGVLAVTGTICVIAVLKRKKSQEKYIP